MNPYSVDFWKPMTDSLYRNDDLEKKSALNQMVHRTMDRSGRDRFVASGTENAINLSPSAIKLTTRPKITAAMRPMMVKAQTSP